LHKRGRIRRREKESAKKNGWEELQILCKLGYKRQYTWDTNIAKIVATVI